MRDRLRELNGFPYFVGVWVCGTVGAFVGTSIGEAWAGGTMHWTAPTLIGKVIGPAFALAGGATGARERKQRRRRAGCGVRDAQD